MEKSPDQKNKVGLTSAEERRSAEFDETLPYSTPLADTNRDSDDGYAETGATVFLTECKPFSNLPAYVVRLLESRMQEEKFAEGEFLLRQGDPGTSLMVICDGIVEISTEDETGERHSIDEAYRGEVLGEMALLTNEPRSANVVAKSPVTALVLPADVFHELATRYPVISMVLTTLVATRLGNIDHDVLAGKTLDAYRIKRRLGRGGMAVVYEATDTRSAQRVALKMMSHYHVYDSTALKQFQREADLIESFEHDNIVKMYGRFEAFRTFFTVMQFCDGETLSKVIRLNGPLPEAESRKIIGQVVCALEYAHRADVIHRDVKPTNIMLNRDGNVKLMDFGLAKPIAGEEIIRQGSIVGTPAYMAPEQMTGAPVGKEADYFSLGCVAYEILCGKPLFPKKGITRILRQDTLLDTTNFRQQLAGVSEELIGFLEQCLHRDPQKRQLDLNKLARWAGPIDTNLLPDRFEEPSTSNETTGTATE